MTCHDTAPCFPFGSSHIEPPPRPPLPALTLTKGYTREQQSDTLNVNSTVTPIKMLKKAPVSSRGYCDLTIINIRIIIIMIHIVSL